MRADRLLRLTSLLRHRGRMTAAELAERLEVDRRTVLRDIEALSAAGVPVYAERGRHGGFALLPGFTPDATELTAAEATALLASGGSAAMDRLGLGPALASGLRKLGADLPPALDAQVQHTSERLVVDEVGWIADPGGVDQLGDVQRAVFTDRRLRFSYRPRPPGRAGLRTVDPYGLLLAGPTWYLIAAHRGRPRSYRLSRMADVRVLEQASARPADLDLRALWHQLRRAYTEVDGTPVTVRVPPRWRELVLAQLAGQFTAPPTVRPEGSELVIEGETRALRGVAGVLAGYGTMIEVLEPPELRRLLAEVGAQLTAFYGEA